MRTRVIRSAVLAVACAGCSAAGIAPDVPLEERPVASPGPDVPRTLAAFSGRWAGVWSDGPGYRKNMALVIENVAAPDKATGTYACGHQYPTPFRYCPGSMAVSGRLEGETLLIPYPAIPAEGRFRIEGGSLRGELVDPAGKVLIRVNAQRVP